MKLKGLFLVISLLSLIQSYGQKVIDNPKFGFTSVPELKMRQISCSDTATVIQFVYCSDRDTKISIPWKTYIQIPGKSDTLFLRSSQGIAQNKWTPVSRGDSLSYQLCFPPLPSDTKQIDYGEGNSGGSWFIYDIALQDRDKLSKVPQWLNGNWFLSGTNNWQISFLDTFALFRQQCWSYKSVNFKKRNGEIVLTSNNRQIILKIERDKKLDCSIELITGKSVKLCHRPTLGIAQPIDSMTEISWIPKATTISGYLLNYSPRIKSHSIMLYCDNIITGDQDAIYIPIATDGSFSKTIDLSYPHKIYLRSPAGHTSIYMEPGETTFVYLSPNNELFMGTTAQLNRELQQLETCTQLNFQQADKQILQLSATDFKKHWLEQEQSSLKRLKDSAQTRHYSARAIQICQMNINYSYTRYLLGYSLYFSSAYRKAHKISRSDRISIPMDTLGLAFYDFLTPQLVNNPVAPLTNSYDNFINYLSYNDEIYPRTITMSSLTDTVTQILSKNRDQLSPKQKESLTYLLQLDSLNKLTNLEEIKKIMGHFIDTYNKTLQYHSNQNMLDYVDSLKQKGIQLNDDEKQMIQTLKDSTNSKELKTYFAFREKHSNFIKENLDSLETKIAEKIFLSKRHQQVCDNLKSKFNIPEGLASDLIFSQMIYQKYLVQYTPLPDSFLKQIKNEFFSESILPELQQLNQKLIQKIAYDSKNINSNKNLVPDSCIENVFDSIMTKYKGKLVYVDVWATWCSPCRSGIKQIAPLKEEEKDKPIVFVYLTGETSPLKAWKNMTSSISGEHYRLTTDQWNALKAQFHISGIPHYILVGKDGKVINPNVPHFSANNQLKHFIEHYL